jgi:excisionase family DNA binding protein
MRDHGRMYMENQMDPQKTYAAKDVDFSAIDHRNYPNMDPETLHSVEGAAARCGGVSKWAIYLWLSQGRLRKTKVGSRVMIRESDLQAFIAKCNPQPDTPALERAK